MQVRLAALAAELRGALRALLPLRLAHRFPGQAIHFIRGRDGGAGNWCGRRRRRHLGDPGAWRLPGGWPGQSAEHRHGGPAPLRPAPAVPPSRSASCSSPDSASLPPPRAALPPPGAGGGARAAQVTDARKRADGGEPEVWTAGASARVRTPGRPDGPLARGVRTGLQQLPPALSARAAAERSFSCQRWPLIARGGHPHPDPWILGSLERCPRSASRAYRPPTEHAWEATATT